MRKVWIVVANSAESKIYRAENVNSLVLHRALSHQESRQHEHEVMSDGPGKMGAKSRYGLDVVQPRTTFHEKEAKIFAQQIVAFLEEGYVSGECERIYIIAKAPFLGVLRESLTPNVIKLVESEIHKDVVYHKPEHIREYLPPVL